MDILEKETAKLKGKKVFITGASGFLGMNVVETLTKSKLRPTVLILPGEKLRWDKKKVKVLRADITDREAMFKLVKGYDLVINIAGLVEARDVKPELFFKVNRDGTRNVLEAAVAGAAKRIVHISSVGVFGPLGRRLAGETHLYNPINVYEKSKYEGELVAKKLIKKGAPINIIRPTLVYGPYDTNSGMFALFNSISNKKFLLIAGGNYNFHPAYVENVVEAILLCANRRVVGEDFIIGDEKVLTLKEFSSLIYKYLGKKPWPFSLPYTLAKFAGYCGDLAKLLKVNFPITSSRVWFMTNHRGYKIDKAKKLLGYKAHVSTEEGARRAVAWYRKKKFL